MLRGLISGALWIRLGSVGLDLESGSQRMTFGCPELMDSVPLIAVAIGTLALSEMFVQLDRVRSTPAAQRIVIGRSPEVRMTWPIFRSCVPKILRGKAIGAFVGFLPGLGTSVASFVTFIVTPMLELNLRQSLVLSHGDPMILLERLIALVFLLLTLAGLWQLGTSRRRLNITAPRPQPAPRSKTERS